MHTLLLVVVPDGVADIVGFVENALRPHRCTEGTPGHWDYYVIGGRWDGRFGFSRGAPFTVENNLSAVGLAISDRLLGNCGAVLIDGNWIADTDFDSQEVWLRYCQRLLREQPEAQVVTVDIHS
jgi:hypothetical protein